MLPTSATRVTYCDEFAEVACGMSIFTVCDSRCGALVNVLDGNIRTVRV